MNKLKSLFRWAAFFSIAVLLFAYGAVAENASSNQNDDSGRRADLILIDTMKVFGELERPPVEFLHDRHTDALQKQEKDCSVCHEKTDKGQLIPKFKRRMDEDRKTTEDIYHENCIDCHKEMTGKVEKSGPVACGECHKEEPSFLSSRQPMGLDKYLHYRHVKAYDKEKKCETCHHEYNKATKQLLYVKDKEGSCRYCHKQVTEENRMSMALASHAACVNCHLDKASRKQDGGPVKCQGCHDLKSQKMFREVFDVPRMDRKQPDTVLIKAGDETLDATVQSRMNFVPFDHKAHEGYNDTCRVCHHADISTCSKCHPLSGAKEGDGISLELAMHKDDAMQSCEGCHNAAKENKECSGCHSFISENRDVDTDSCLKCHMAQKENTTENTKDKDDAISAMLLASRNLSGENYTLSDIPEKVVIKKLSKKYEPAEFPHRQIVKKLVEDIKTNKIAAYFHAEKGTVCQGCHHNGPATLTPTRCANCHNEPFNENDMHKPGLLGAYHRQCMECHDNIGLEKPAGCTGCHKEK
ncbi:MAG: cytochrome C [Proteobacteria bacterium]|nr:cytochrome C [Pseudomonadota bacterium]